MKIELHDPESQLLKELTWEWITQESVALTYAFIIRQCGDRADWPRINAAIKERWKGKAALDKIKKLAWKSLGA